MLSQFLIHNVLLQPERPQPACCGTFSTPTEEQHLLTAAMAGNQRAYAILWGRFQKMVLSITLDITATREDAEEAMQDTFLRAFRYLPGFRGESSFKTWLAHIARRTAFTKLRRQPLPTVAMDAPWFAYSQLPDHQESPLQHLQRQERVNLLNEAIARLSLPDETALRLFYWHEQSLEEICNTTGWSLANAKSRVHRARLRLRKVLETQLAEEPGF